MSAPDSCETFAYAYNPFPLMRRASGGDVEAMRVLAENAARCAVEGQSDAAMVVAVTFARLAFYRSNNVDDGGMLVSILALASNLFGESEVGEEARAESLAVLGKLDTEGAELAGAHLPELVGSASREVVALAAQVSDMMKEDC